MGVLEDILDELRIIRRHLVPSLTTANITIQFIREESGNMIVAKLAYPEGVLPDPDTTHAEVGYTEIDDAGNRGETKTASVVLADTFAPVTAGIGLSLVREEADPPSA